MSNIKDILVLPYFGLKNVNGITILIVLQYQSKPCLFVLCIFIRKFNAYNSNIQWTFSRHAQGQSKQSYTQDYFAI
jgi:hypothetical protein